MSALGQYKKLERNAYRQGSWKLRKGVERVARATNRSFASGREKVSLMYVPHDASRPVAFQFPRWAFFLAAALVSSGLVAVVFIAFGYRSLAREVEVKSKRLEITQSQLDTLRDEVARTMKSARRLEGAIAEAAATKAADDAGIRATGDLSPFFNLAPASPDSIDEISGLKQVADTLERTSRDIREQGILTSSRYALNDIPTLWPIKSGRGMISMYFGQNKDPFTRQWYIHRGVDIITGGMGDPIAATGNGEVVQATYTPSYGNHVMIKHHFGFYSLYAHLQSARVSKGQKVQQGQIIGYLGRSGKVTGPHLHYEIYVGTSIVDPLKYLNRPDKPKAIAPAGNF